MMIDLSNGQLATLACLLEVTAPKPGNVHRAADFDDMSFTDMVASAVAIEPAMQLATQIGVGHTVLSAVTATERLVRKNTNLGTILLMAPLATVGGGTELQSGVQQVLNRLTSEDARLVYQAIRRASPGGLGSADRYDVATDAPDQLLAAMHEAADRDLVAYQYAHGFETVFDDVIPTLQRCRESHLSLTSSIIHTQMVLMSRFPDSLIRRKCGPQTAGHAAALAGAVLDSGAPDSEEYCRALRDLDFWLRADGHRRNPGTTADLIAAGIFAALRTDAISPPFT